MIGYRGISPECMTSSAVDGMFNNILCVVYLIIWYQYYKFPIVDKLELYLAFSLFDFTVRSQSDLNFVFGSGASH